MTYFDIIFLFHLTTTGFSVVSADDDKTALANKGLFEVTQHPLWTQADKSSSVETTKNLVVVRSKSKIMSKYVIFT